MTDKAQVTREELMAMREVARKAFCAARGWVQDLPLVYPPHRDELAAYLDREFPLPEPEPQQVTMHRAGASPHVGLS